MDPQEILTPEEAAEVLKVTPYTARKWIRTNHLKGGFKIGAGRQWRIRRADVDAYLSEQARKSEGGQS